ncbi:Basic 7S globulin 2, partial [Dichanthelium oligosanthes]
LFSSPSIYVMPVQASSHAIQALVAPITKDAATSLYTLSLSHKQFLLDLSGPLLWSPCSPAHPTIPCSSGECAAAPGPPKFCDGQCTCTARPTNPVTGERAVGDLTLTDVATNATDGNTPTAEVTVHGVLSSCAPDSLLRSFPSAAAGDAGLGRRSLSLPSQLYVKLSLAKRLFAICLPSTAAAPGVAFFGSGPYGLMPPTQFDAGAVLSYTDLVRDPMRPYAYGIRLRGIAVNQEAVWFPAGALDRGGGVTLDTALPYTVLRRDVYRSFVDAFRRATALVPRAPGVAPFELCFNSSALGFTRVGYAVAPVDLMMAARGGGNWTVFGANSMAQVAPDVACLAFVDGGWAAPSAVAVGAFQMENNFLVFDEAASRLGFSGTLLFIRTTCGNFNFARGISIDPLYKQSEQMSRQIHRTHFPSQLPAHRMKMPRQPKPLLLMAVSVLVLAWPASCADPVLFPVAKDAATSLYTIAVRDGANHVIDLAGPLLWSTCAADHLPANFTCKDPVCNLANAYHPPGCREAGQPCKQRCKAYPYNAVTGRCAAASLIHTRLVANTTDGRNPRSQVSVRAVAACAPKKLLARLPRGAVGIAGLAASGLALPAQAAASKRVADKFTLCLPQRGEGVAIFGGGPLFLLPESAVGDLTSTLAFTPLRSRKYNPGYYLPVKAIAVDKARVPLSRDALATGGVVLGTTAPYTALRPDVYRPFVDAFDKALKREWKNTKKVPAVAPFELCYDSKTLPGPTRIGWLVPDIDLVLEGGKTNWTFGGLSSMVDVNNFTAACFGFVEMTKPGKGGYGGAPAVVIGGFQMENHVLQFDLEKRRLGFARVPVFTSCSNFNFTRAG